MLFLCVPQSTVRQAGRRGSHTFSERRLKHLWESLLLCNSSGIISANPTPGPHPEGRAMPAAGPLPPALACGTAAGVAAGAGGGVLGAGGVPGAGQAACCRQEEPGGAARGWTFWGAGCWCGAAEDAELSCRCCGFRAGLASLIGSKWLCTRRNQLAKIHALP